MLFAYIAVFTNMFAFLLPPFRQYRGRYFLFFLVLALGDPLTFLAIEIAHITPSNFNSLVAWATFLSVFTTNRMSKGFFILLILTVMVFLAFIFFNRQEAQFLNILINCLLLIYFIKESAQHFQRTNEIHLGYFLLVLYQIGIITKLYTIAEYTKQGILYFYIIALFEIIVAIFFTIYKVENSPVIKLAGFGEQKL
jgi:hypothetical protein